MEIALKQSLENNITKIYLLKFFSMFLVLMPVIVPFFQSIGIGMRGVYLLQSCFAITVFVLEIPSGYISDLLGRKNTLIFSLFLKGIGFSLFPIADSLSVLIIAEIILGVAVSLSSGTDTALIYDTLEALNSKKAEIKILGKSISYLSLGEGIASVIASFIMMFSVSLKYLAAVSAFMSWIPLVIAFTIVEPPRIKMQMKHKENLVYIFEKMFKQSRLLNLIILNSIFSFSGTLFAVWLFQKYWANISIPIVYFGFLWGVTNFTVSFSSRKAHKVEKYIGSKQTLILIGFLPIAGYFGISYIDHFIGYLICLLFQLCRGFGQVVLKDALNKRVTGDFRATANSITQMGVRILFTFLGPLLGHVIDQQGLSFATQLMAYIYILVFILVLIPLLKQSSNFIPINK